MSQATPSTGMFSSGDASTVSSIPLHDADPALGQASLGQLVKTASAQVSTLVRAEVELAKKEVTEQVRRGVTGSVYFIIAGILALTSILPFIFFAAKLISMWLGTLSWDWAGFLIVFVSMLVLAGVFVLLGVKKVKSVEMPEKTLQSARDLQQVIPGARGDAVGA